MSDSDGFGAFLIGFVVGAVAGGVAALLLAPQSGEETRTLIRDKSIELRDQAAEQAKQLQSKAMDMGKDLQQRGQAVYEDVSARGKDLVDSAKKAVTKGNNLVLTSRQAAAELQDPKQKARRLARALISDMLVYHPEKRQQGIRDGTLPQLFKDEIEKSWLEYVEQVGREMADGTPFWTEALNEILAGGKKLF